MFYFVTRLSLRINSDEKSVGLYFGCFFKNSSGHPGTDVMIFDIFSPKKSAKKLSFLTQNEAKF
jgi:hypothetical protein